MSRDLYRISKKLPAEEEQREENEEETLLLEAAASGDLTEMQKLIDKEVDVNCDDMEGNTPLHLAILHGNRECIKMLMKAGAGTEILNKDYETPLHVAVDREDEETVKELLEANVDVDARDRSGNTPLHIACIKGYESVIRTLIAKDADCKAPGADGNSSLHLAAKFGGLPAVESLLAVDADVDAVNDSFDTPLHLSAGSEGSDVVRALLKAGAKWFVLNNEGNLPLHAACKEGNLDAVQLLILKSQPEALNTQNEQGYTPLHLAAEHQQTEIVKELIAAGADVDAKDEDGGTPCDVTPGWCEELKELLTRTPFAIAADRRGRGTPDLAYCFHCSSPCGSESPNKAFADPDEGHGVVLCPDCYLDVGSSERPGDQTETFLSNKTSNENRELHLGRRLLQHNGGYDDRNLLEQHDETREQVLRGVVTCTTRMFDTSFGPNTDLRLVEHVRPGVNIANYIIDGDALQSNSMTFPATSKAKSETVWLMFCRERRIFETMVKIYELLKEAEYVSKLVEVIAECPGWPALPPLLVIERGSDSLKSSLNENRLDSHTKEQILNQILSGFNELRGNGVIHGKVDLSTIEYFPRSHRWKLSILGFPQIRGGSMDCCLPSVSSSTEMVAASKDRNAIVAERCLDWWWYEAVARAVHTGKDICSYDSLFDTPETVSWGDELAERVQSITAGCFRDFSGSLLLSGPKTRKHPRHVSSDCLRCMQSSAAIALLSHNMTTWMNDLKQIRQATIMTAGQVQCFNMDIALSLKHPRSTISLSQPKEEEDVLVLYDDSLPQFPIYALENGGVYIIEISLVQKHGLQPPVEKVLGIDLLQSDETVLSLRTEKVVCNYPEYKVRAFLDVSKLKATQFHAPSPCYGGAEEKFPLLNLFINCTTAGVLSLPVQPKMTIHCCMFPKGSKCWLQKLRRATRNAWLSAPQTVRDVARFGTGCVNTATGLAGMATI